MFKTNPVSLKELLNQIESEKLQLPDFQRDWVWTDEGIRSLIGSIGSGFPIGAILTLQTGGDVRFKPRALETAPSTGKEPETLLLDGQQRMTTCYQVLRSQTPVQTQNSKGKEMSVYYFVDMKRAIAAGSRLENAIVTTLADMKVKTNFNKDIVLDLSTPALQYGQHMFPLNRTLDAMRWFMEYQQFHGEDGFATYSAFDKILDRVRDYMVPVIQLDKENSREAVCTVFEKVNVGGKKLDAFELLTAMFAADTFDLREDLRGTDIDNFIKRAGRKPKTEEIREGRLTRIRAGEKNGVFEELSERDVLQVAALLQTYEERQAAIQKGETDPKRVPAVRINADALLQLRCASYQKNADAIEQGFVKARQFFNRLYITRWWDVPYLPAAKTLAAVYALWDGHELNAAATQRLERWFWCISLGETYGSSTDTRVARDVLELLPWLRNEGPQPRAIEEVSIRADRMDRLTTRIAAGYKAIYAALLHEGCQDFRTGTPAHRLVREDRPIDIHHIFPQAWAKKNNIPRERYDTIVNKTPLFRETNQIIGGGAPSNYLKKLTTELNAYGAEHGAAINLASVLATHRIEADALLRDAFEDFYQARKEALAQLIELKTGLKVVRSESAALSPEAEDIDDVVADDEAASIAAE
ncbi:MAG: hypothetical protein DCF16_05280 [Alphaproteobacteria bacterium]|nr:MAG: hypothetical protein DCF16_05280 [Alphaproteobacteria bacterium]